MVELFDLHSLVDFSPPPEPVVSLESQLETEKRQVEALMAQTQEIRENPDAAVLNPTLNLENIKVSQQPIKTQQNQESKPNFWSKVSSFFAGMVRNNSTP